MLQYILRRILLFIPTLVVISLLAFALSKIAPGDPVEAMIEGGVDTGTLQRSNRQTGERIYQETAERLGLHKPVFYFEITSQAYPDTLHRITRKNRREALEKLIAQYGNWPAIQIYYRRIRELETLTLQLPDTIAESAARKIWRTTQELYVAHSDAKIQSQFAKMHTALEDFSHQNPDELTVHNRFAEYINQLESSYEQVKNATTPKQLYVPDFKWYGFDNQYHNWFINFLQADFGVSYRDHRPVWSKIKDALYWTLLMNLLAIFFAYALSIPLGVWSATHKGSTFDRVNTVILFMLYSLPTFWIATMLIVFFTTPEYGRWMDIFPSTGLGDLRSDAPFWDRFWERAGHLILPVFCLTYTSLAFITRQMRGGMLDIIGQDYIRTARAKGLPERVVVWKHAFRNALFPIITLLASIFPAVLAGSVIIEYIFGIPGMGRLALDSITARDWPTVFAILMMGAVLTMVGILVADVLYALADPRVAYGKKGSS